MEMLESPSVNPINCLFRCTRTAQAVYECGHRIVHQFDFQHFDGVDELGGVLDIAPESGGCSIYDHFEMESTKWSHRNTIEFAVKY